MIERSASFIAGMPNLSLCGLSENWLLKECGNQHWLALAQWFGMELPAFTDAEGGAVYAAFVAVKLTKAKLQLIDENAAFTLQTRLVPYGRARFYSIHSVVVDGQEFAQVTMLSTLVTRREAGNNQSVIRTDVNGGDATGANQVQTQRLQAEANTLAESAKAFRSESWDQWHQLTPGTYARLPGITFHPCPHSDFNGADFLYFANFQAACDRAEWSWNRNRHLWQICDRQLNYYGNINIGDALQLEFASLKHDDNHLTHWLTIYRDSDGQKIADVVTHKQRINNAGYRWATMG